jgi:DNA-binding NtrC family response regulator
MRAMRNILIVEDERVIRTALRRLLERNGYTVAEAGSVPEAESEHDLDGFDLIISDLRLPGPPGTDIIHKTGEAPVLIMTSYASVKSAVDAMQQGAADYIAKPFDHDEMLHAVARILESRRLKRQNKALKSDLLRDYPVLGIVGECEGMQQVFQHIHKVAPTDTTVLILGESGTGKELVARAVHEHSPRHDAPLIAVNCAAIAEGLIEAELFGHERGAFTGAVTAREGLVESAHGGTLFLDEIGELPAAAQGRLLRVLQEGEIRRVGSSRVAQVDIRLIAATNRDLAQLVEERLFRRDLYYRLRVMEISLPPLRERGPDIAALANYMLDKVSKRLNRPGLSFSADAEQAIAAYPWPGNVRELENAVERAVILAEGAVVTGDLLAVDGASIGVQDTPTPVPLPETPSPELSLDDYFVHFVTQHENQMTETELARRLGISRKSLWERRQRLGIPKRGRRKI